jgi:hypothetical protein
MTKAKTAKPAIVEKIIPPAHPDLPEKAQIAVQGADELYREIRIENSLENERGKKVKLKPGAHVLVSVEADSTDTYA